MLVAAEQPFWSAAEINLIKAQEAVISGFLLPVMGLEYLMLIIIAIFSRSLKKDATEKIVLSFIIIHGVVFFVLLSVLILIQFAQKKTIAYMPDPVGLFILTWSVVSLIFFGLQVNRHGGVRRIIEYMKNAFPAEDSPAALAVEAPEEKNEKDKNKKTANISDVEEKLNAAKKLLAEKSNQMSLFKIAEASGFASKEALDRALRKAEGLTAVEYRLKRRK